MDPDETLRRLRALVTEIDRCESPDTGWDLADEIAELVGALDGWLTGGGFPPADWRRAAWETR